MTPEERLISNLLANYTKEARPVKNPKHKVVVVFGFELVQLVNVVSNITVKIHEGSGHHNRYTGRYRVCGAIAALEGEGGYSHI